MKLLRPKPNNFRRLNFALPLLLIFFAQKVCAQLAPADDFFNRGAQLYISNNIPAAKEQVETGLKIYPDDEKLKKLEELLKQQQQQQQQQQQNQQSQPQQNQSQNQNSSQQQKNQQNQNQQNQSQQNQQQQSQQQKNSQEQQAKNQEQKNEEQKQQEQKAAAEKATGQTNENQNAGREVAAAQMTPEEAKRLLDSQKGDEQFLQLKPQGKPEDAQRKINDW